MAGPRDAREQEAVLRKLLDHKRAGGERASTEPLYVCPDEHLAGETPPTMQVASVEGTSEPGATGSLVSQGIASLREAEVGRTQEGVL